MRAPRIFCVWTALGLCAVTVFGAMTWLTRNVLAAERERAKARHERALAESRADIEERTRLALWRMDALGAAIALRENRHPVDDYELTTQQSPFFSSADPEVLLHFQIKQGQGIISPELDPQGDDMKSGVDEKTIERRRERMQQLRALLAANPVPGDEWTKLNCAAVNGQDNWNAIPKDAYEAQAVNIEQRQKNPGDFNRRDSSYQGYSNTNEYAQRAKVVSKSIESAVVGNNGISQKIAQPDGEIHLADLPAGLTGALRFTDVADVSPMSGVWLGGELFLLRQVVRLSPNLAPYSGPAGRVAPISTKSVQGVWLDSDALRKLLLAEVADLLPKATLVPAIGENVSKDPLTLVSFPFRLKRNEIAIAAMLPEEVKFGAPLQVGWAAVILAVLATSFLVRGVMRLSERRASFVSAVTHELRTPLTTFRLYSEMLESGAVKPEKRGDYLRVLSREADRLSHLVENVLAFSRIERGNARSNVREIAAGALLEQSRERLEARLATAGLRLEMDDACRIQVRADTTAVEHILFNLIDNAAKYAVGSEPPVVRVDARQAGRFVEIHCCDHGPGIPNAEHRRIFRAFHKSAREAAESKPGVGLGLALSRRLAREQGGDLLCHRKEQGSCFVLRLPVA